jgi:hypothetical protein
MSKRDTVRDCWVLFAHPLIVVWSILPYWSCLFLKRNREVAKNEKKQRCCLARCGEGHQTCAVLAKGLPYSSSRTGDQWSHESTLTEETRPEWGSLLYDNVCMDGTYVRIQKECPSVQCFVSPAHGMDGLVKNVGSSVESIRIQANVSSISANVMGISSITEASQMECNLRRALLSWLFW